MIFSRLGFFYWGNERGVGLSMRRLSRWPFVEGGPWHWFPLPLDAGP